MTIVPFNTDKYQRKDSTSLSKKVKNLQEFDLSGYLFFYFSNGKYSGNRWSFYIELKCESEPPL